MSFVAMGRELPRVTAKAVAQPKGVQPASDASKTETPKSPALEALTKFIPTELLAPYVTALSLAATQKWDASAVYAIFVVATPAVFVLVELAKSALGNLPWPAPKPLVWRALAALVAFAAWGLSAPTNPMQAAIGGAAVAGFLAMVVSPLLSALDAIVLRLLASGSVGAA